MDVLDFSCTVLRSTHVFIPSVSALLFLFRFVAAMASASAVGIFERGVCNLWFCSDFSVMIEFVRWELINLFRLCHLLWKCTAKWISQWVIHQLKSRMVSDRLYCLKSSELDLKVYYCKPPTHFHLIHLKLLWVYTANINANRSFFDECYSNVIEFSYG